MAAPLGFKTFNSGDVLTAADTNGYLMQGIWVFANAAARDAAVTSPQEGNSCYLKDTDQILVYSGSAWVVKSGSSPLTTKGDVYTYSTTDARLAVGTNGQYLSADSTAATGLKWVTPAAAGGYTLISTTTLSGATTTLSTIPGTYRDLVLIIKQITNGSSYVPRFTINNNTTDNYHWSKGSFGTGSASWGTDYNVTTGWDLTNQGTNQDGAASTNYHRIFLPDYANTTSPKIMQSQSYGISTLGGSPYSNFVVGYLATTTAPTAAITSIEIKVSAGSATGGTALLYGVS